MIESTIQRYDKSNMRKLLVDLPLQIEEAVQIGNSASVRMKASPIQNIVITGLGGSAIGGDLLRSYIAGDLEIPLIVNRTYTLPDFVGRKSLVIVSSYSGGTEETIAAHNEARRRGAMLVAISSGGETEKMAHKFRHPFIKIPKGLPPRAAIGYSFFPTLILLTKLRLITSREKDIRETVKLLQQQAKQFASLDDKNPALNLAKQFYTRLPIIYSSSDRFDVVNLRWRGQLAENAKVLAFGHVLPEMNHNELVGWKVLQRQMAEMTVVFLRDGGEHPRVKERMRITRGIVGEFANRVIEVESKGNSLLARIFSLVYLGDWTSYYLALLNGVDPTPVRIIDYLKWELTKL